MNKSEYERIKAEFERASVEFFADLEKDSLFTNKPGATGFFESLAKETHILIAGRTGSGKSVIINDFINTLITTQARGSYGLLLCDPKRVEFKKYDTRKARNTFLYGYYNTPEKILSALQLLENEMDRRFKKMEKRGLDKYDGRHIYCIVDEIADLMTNNKLRKEFTRVLQRLLQLARASGIHIICATQQLKAVVLPTILTCNFTAIVGLQTRTPTESRLIIGEPVLTTLPQYGECYYLGKDGLKHITEIPYIKSDEIINNINGL